MNDGFFRGLATAELIEHAAGFARGRQENGVIAVQNQRIVELQNIIAQQNAEIEDLASKNDNLYKEGMEVVQECRVLKRRSEQLEEEVDGLRRQLKELQLENGAAAVQANTMIAEFELHQENPDLRTPQSRC